MDCLCFGRDQTTNHYLNGFCVSFGDSVDIHENKDNEINNKNSYTNIPDISELLELLENFNVIEDENCDGFDKCYI